jgi:hypothetical protein
MKQDGKQGLHSRPEGKKDAAGRAAVDLFTRSKAGMPIRRQPMSSLMRNRRVDGPALNWPATASLADYFKRPVAGRLFLCADFWA